MFNGITSQMSSWIGKKQEDVEETVPSPKTELPEEYIEKKDDLRYFFFWHWIYLLYINMPSDSYYIFYNFNV